MLLKIKLFYDILLLLSIMLLFNGCCNSKVIHVSNSNGAPVPDVLVAAYQQNIFLANEKRMFKTDINGQATIPFSGFVSLFIGKKGYYLKYVGASKSNVKIILIPYGSGSPELNYISHFTSDIYKIPPEKLWLEWVEYIEWLKKRRAGAAGGAEVGSTDFGFGRGFGRGLLSVGVFRSGSAFGRFGRGLST